MQRIAIIGAHGVGKTTLQKKINLELKDKNKSVINVNDIARLCPFQVGEKSNVEAQEWILSNQLFIESLFQYNDSYVIFDGCSLSHIAYYKYWGGDISSYLNDIMLSSKIFDKIILLPSNKDFLIDDGLRPVDIDFQRKIHEIIVDILNDLHLEYFLVDPKETEDIIEKVFFFNSSQTKKQQNQKIVIQGLVTDGNKILIARRNDPGVPEADGKWDLPGGTVNINEPPESTVIRELFEETGYLVKIEKLLPTIISNIWGMGEKSFQAIVICYECRLQTNIVFTDQSNDEILELKWIERKNVAEFNFVKGVSTFIKI